VHFDIPHFPKLS